MTNFSRNSLIVFAFAALVLAGGGCLWSSQAPVQPEEKNSPKAVEAQEPQEVAEECKPVGDGYRYDNKEEIYNYDYKSKEEKSLNDSLNQAHVFYSWLDHIERFPISDKYQHLQALGGGIGELNYSVLARALTASDCSVDRLEEFMGGEDLNQQIDFVSTYIETSPSPSSDFKSLLTETLQLDCRNVTSSPGAIACDMRVITINKLLKVKPFIDQIATVGEY